MKAHHPRSLSSRTLVPVRARVSMVGGRWRPGGQFLHGVRIAMVAGIATRKRFAGAAGECIVCRISLPTDRTALQQRARGSASGGHRRCPRHSDESRRAQRVCAGDCRGRRRRVSRSTRPRAGRRSGKEISRASSSLHERAASTWDQGAERMFRKVISSKKTGSILIGAATRRG